MKFVGKILDLLFPLYCIGCNNSGAMLCENCQATISKASYEPGEENCSIFSYQDKLMKRAIWKLKYEGKKRMADDFGQAVYERVLETASDYREMYPSTKFVLVPIPLSRTRRAERGYNQAELLARSCLRHDRARDFTYEPNILIKIRDTVRQVKTGNRRARLNNLKDCFAISSQRELQKLRGKVVILIDDILTTGATLAEARRALKNAGVKKVLAVTLAH